MQHDFSQLRNDVIERKFVRVYSLPELPLRAQGFGLPPSKCPVVHNPECILKYIVKKREYASVLNLEKPKKNDHSPKIYKYLLSYTDIRSFHNLTN